MRNIPTAYALALMTFFGFAGLHRFYLGKPFTGLLWLATWGFGGIGTLYDILTLPSQVDDFNRKLLPPGAPPMGQLPAAVPAPPPESMELRLLKLARRQEGRLTPLVAATDLGIDVSEAESELDELCRSGHAEIQVSEEGVIYYEFPSLREV